MSGFVWIYLGLLVTYPWWGPAVLGLLSPVQGDGIEKRSDLNKEKTEKTINIRAAVLFLTVLIVGTVIISWFLTLLAGLSERQWKGEIYLQTIDPAYWTVAAIFLAILAAGYFTFLFLKIKFPAMYGEYIITRESWITLDNLKLFRGLFHFIMPVMLIFLAAGINQYRLFNSEKISENRYFRILPVEYPYKDIKEVYLVYRMVVPNGSIREEKHYVILFSNSNIMKIRDSDIPWPVFEEKILPQIGIIPQQIDFYPPTPD